MAGRRDPAGEAGFWLVAVACAPLVGFLIVMGGLRFGGLGVDAAIDDWVFGVGRFLILASVAAAALSLVLALRTQGRTWLAAVLAVVVAGLSAGLFWVQQPKFAAAAPNDVTTNPADPVAYSGRGQEGRATSGVVAACPGVSTVPRQVEVEAAETALKAAGFDVTARAHFRAEGNREGFWLGLTHDAVVRIRPGETDVRVTARRARAQGDEACRLLAEIVSRLNR